MSATHSTQTSPTTLNLEGLTVRYDRHEVLHGVSGTVRVGEIVAVLGPNGVGKSTLLKACLHLVSPDGGRVLLGDQDVAGMDAPRRARSMALLPQALDWSFPFRAGEVVLMGRHPYQATWQFESEEDVALARDAMRRTGTWELRDRLLNTLSGGEAQRVMLASALVQQPDFLFLDEPTANLDLHHQAEFLDILRGLPAQGVGVIMASHDLSLSASVADRLWLLHDGRIAFEGPPAEVLTPANLEAVYGLPCEVQDGPGSLRVLPRWDQARSDG